MTEQNFNRALETLKRQKLEASLMCPFCQESNTKGRSPLIMLDERGIASCDQCGRTFTPPKE